MRAEHSCADHESELSALLDGRLPPRSEVRLRRHLAECEGCRAELQALGVARSLVRSLPVRDVPAGLFTQSLIDPEVGRDRAAPGPQPTLPSMAATAGAGPARYRRSRTAATALAMAAMFVGVMMTLGGAELVVPIDVDIDTLAAGHQSVASASGVPMPIAGGVGAVDGTLDPDRLSDDGAATLLDAAARGSGVPIAGETMVMWWPDGPHSPAEVSGTSFSVTPVGGDGHVGHALADPTDKYDIEVGQVEYIMDRPCLRIDLRLTEGEELREQVWIDQTSGVFLRRETFEDGERRRSVSYRSLDLDATPAPVPAPESPALQLPAVESLALHEPGQVAALRASGWDIPDVLPGGYHLVGASVRSTLPGMPLQVLYSDGLYVASLFLQPGQPDLDVVAGTAEHVDALTDRAAYLWAGLPNRMIWTGSGRTYTLIGDAPADDMTTMASGFSVG